MRNIEREPMFTDGFHDVWDNVFFFKAHFKTRSVFLAQKFTLHLTPRSELARLVSFAFVAELTDVTELRAEVELA